jgi:hypothetical protein
VSGGRVSRVKSGSERSGVDFFYKLMESNVESKTRWAVQVVLAHGSGSVQTLGCPK